MPLIGTRIAWARKKAGYHSQGTFATALGVSRGLVGQWEAHGKTPGRDNLAKIALLCGISADYLLGATSLDERTITTSIEREVKLLLAFRRMSVIQQERLAEFLADEVKVPSVVKTKTQPA
jgi:transcriptional regulator with XRE-family HTH domain